MSCVLGTHWVVSKHLRDVRVGTCSQQAQQLPLSSDNQEVMSATRALVQLLPLSLVIGITCCLCASVVMTCTSTLDHL